MKSQKLILVGLMFLLFVSLSEGKTYQKETTVDLKIPFEVDGSIPSGSAVCNISIQYPNSSYVIDTGEMTNRNNGEFNYTINSSLLTELGEYDWVAFCCDGSECAVGYDSFEITRNGNPTPDGMPTFQMGIIIIIFGISCFLLYLSSQMNEVGFKIFFLITSLIFLLASIKEYVLLN